MVNETLRWSAKSTVHQKILYDIWTGLQSKLSQSYPVDKIQMPKVRAYIPTSNEYIKITDKLYCSPNLKDNSVTEYGEKIHPDNSAAVIFFSTKPRAWIILACDGRGRLVNSHIHETGHVFERVLGLEWGRITNQLSARS